MGSTAVVCVPLQVCKQGIRKAYFLKIKQEVHS